ncbi:MAG: tagatose 1,6-diphosphate aldolase [Bryobacteraceae bacterium]|nr:tagatose 1,6-diphosphate aldolase [Bryobacteraceae bacterium]
MTKNEHLDRLSTSRGVIAAMAIDQRKSLRIMIAAAAGVSLESISDQQLGEFKSTVVRHLSPHASAVLIDPEFGSPAMGQQAESCGLLLTYEMDGYENPRPHRMLALMPEYSVQRLVEAGANGIKILLSWNPFDDPVPNDHKRALIERIGAECEAVDVPFFLEPVSYDPQNQLDLRGPDFARLKPSIVIDTMREFSQPRYRVDVLKVEFPVNAAYVENSTVHSGQSVYSRDAAIDYYRQADEAAGAIPYIYLSAGVSTNQFTESLRLAAEAEARFSGVLCGRATWQQGVQAYAKNGVRALEDWLADFGLKNIQAVNDCLAVAVPWHSRQSKRLESPSLPSL